MKNSTDQTVSLSFELFPPKTEKAEADLWRCVEALTPLHPQLVSITYGAGGSTRARTHQIVTRMIEETDLSIAAHLTCVDASRADVNQVIADYKSVGVKHIVALRGDSPDGVDQPFTPHPDGYENGADLVKGIKAIGDFKVSVGCYPETHPQSANLDEDLYHLRKKVDNGADQAITQFFLEAESYFCYLDRVQKASLDIPIIPGIMLQPNFQGLYRMAKMCGTHIPDHLISAYRGLDDSDPARFTFMLDYIVPLCEQLIARGCDRLHFYTLNRAEPVLEVCKILGLVTKMVPPYESGEQI